MTYNFEFKIVEDTYCIFNCPPEWHVDEPGAVFHRIYYVYAGDAVYEDDQQCFQLEKGHIYLFPTNKPYKINHDAKKPFACLWFHIIMFPVIFNPIMDLKIENGIEYHLMRALEQAVADHVSYGTGGALVHQTLHSILYLMGLKNKFITLDDPHLYDAITHIHENYMENIPNERLSNLMGYDTSYFIRLFRKTFGLSPQRYITNYRMSKAVSLIRSSMSVSEVAAKVGYTDEKAFSRAFKREKSVPPVEYKKSQYLQP
jgi:AraC-like DNA-binding protein